MTAAAQTLQSHTLAMPGDGRSFKVAGLAFAMLVPALFWVAVIAAVGHAVGFSMTASGLVIVGAAICLFIGTVCAPLMLKA